MTISLLINIQLRCHANILSIIPNQMFLDSKSGTFPAVFLHCSLLDIIGFMTFDPHSFSI